MKIKVTDMHTAGEPVRIVTDGYPQLTGPSILDKRRQAESDHDHIRQVLMLEPRGHGDMYGVIPVTPGLPEAALGVLFTHCSGYSTMCGHATIAMGRWGIDQGLVEPVSPQASFVLECPCGPVSVTAQIDEQKQVTGVSFESVPAFVESLDRKVDTQRHGSVTVDIAYGGAYYAILPASRLGLDLFHSPLAALEAAAIDITNSLRDSYKIQHPVETDLGFLYGTILTLDDLSSTDCNYHLCYFADGQLDRSPTGSGVTARLALAAHRDQVASQHSYLFAGISGVTFSGQLSDELDYAGIKAVKVTVAGSSYYSGSSEFVFENADALRQGFAIPYRAADIWDRSN